MTPRGVQAAKAPGSSWTSRPMDSVPKPSTSLAGATRLKTSVSGRWDGRGAWTRMPWTDASALRASRCAISSAMGTSEGKTLRLARMPTSAAVACFLDT